MTNTNSGYVALTNFITVTKVDGYGPNKSGTVFSPYNKFQNGKHGVVSSHNYLSFVYQGAARNRSGDNMISSLLLANSEISMRFAVEAVTEKYHVKVETYLMTEAFEQKTKLTEEQWLASSMSYDPETIEVILSSAIDAVGANAPDRVLTKEIVGYLPVTGSLQNR
tara:strand:+ start:97 stop:594 length:498 start_codon:yes stop_codon:yes gene_type:complete